MENDIAVFEHVSGKLTYRTRATAGDEFSHTFLRAQCVTDGTNVVPMEEVGRWALKRFAINLTYRQDGEWKTVPFSWKTVDALPREAFADGWLVDAAIAIYAAVWVTSDAEVAGLKKA